MAAPAELAAVAPRRWWPDRTAWLPAAAVLAATTIAWVAVLRQATVTDDPMSMDAPFAASHAVGFVGAWGVMMAAMMLPSAVPMVALYGTVSRALAGRRRLAYTVVFATPYALVWLATGLPAYAMSAAVDANEPLARYGVTVVLVGAGAYQFSAAKRACLRVCREPLYFLASRWRPGVAGAARIGLAHAGYCLGCCWALMVVLVAAGAMGLAWVVLIATLVLAEKVLRYGELTARLAGVVLIGLGLAVVGWPDLGGR